MQPDPTLPSAELVRAVGSLLLADPGRVNTLAASLRAPGRVVESTVEGMSMGSSLPAGSRIRIGLMPQQHFEVGSIIAYFAGSKLVVHRVAHRGFAGQGRAYIVTRGDAPLVPDPPVPYGQILGQVTGVWEGQRWVGICSAQRRTPHARFAAWIFLQLAIVLTYLSPRAAAPFVYWLHRLERTVRSARVWLTIDRGRPSAGQD